MKKKATTVILILVFFLGLSLLLYPSISDWYNSYHQSRVVVSFAEAVSRVNDEEYREMMDAAQDYNRRLAIEDRLGERLTAEQLDDYESQLDVTGTGIMGYIEIHKIRCILPIYHGIDDGVLQIAIGHIPWSSLPIGGAGSHSVLSGHRGLPSARLFTDIDKLDEGDTFIIRTMNKVLTYEVDQIRIVQPNETYDLRIIPGEDRGEHPPPSGPRPPGGEQTRPADRDGGGDPDQTGGGRAGARGAPAADPERLGAAAHGRRGRTGDHGQAQETTK